MNTIVKVQVLWYSIMRGGTWVGKPIFSGPLEVGTVVDEEVVGDDFSQLLLTVELYDEFSFGLAIEQNSDLYTIGVEERLHITATKMESVRNKKDKMHLVT